MAGFLTLAMIKPHAVLERNVGKIISEIEDNDFSILLGKEIQLRKEGAEEFYKEHEDKDFYRNLVNVMSSGPVWVFVLGKTNAVEEWRNLIGATDPAKAEPGTLRHRFGNHENLTYNAVHGSATDHDAQREIGFFFGREINLAEKIDAIDNGREIS
jgi:nucleoside-diphosphate kinase